MELASMFLGFILAFSLYKKSGFSQRLGCIGWLTVFWIYWIGSALLAFFALVLGGFLLKWALIIAAIAYVVSKINNRT